jgi:hypothetical protein
VHLRRLETLGDETSAVGLELTRKLSERGKREAIDERNRANPRHARDALLKLMIEASLRL